MKDWLTRLVPDYDSEWLETPLQDVSDRAYQIAADAGIAGSEVHIGFIVSLLGRVSESEWSDLGQRVVDAYRPDSTLSLRIELSNSLVELVKAALPDDVLDRWAVALLVPRYGEDPEREHGDALYSLAERLFEDRLTLPRSDHPAATAAFEARSVFDDLELDGDVADADFLLGAIYKRCQFFRDATLAYIQARDKFADLNRAHDVACCELQLGGVYRETDQYRLAVRAYERARELFHGLDDPRMAATCEYWLAETHQGRSEWVEAQFSYLRSRDLFLINDFLEEAAQCENNLANVCMSIADYQGAEAAILRRKSLFEHIDNPIAAARCERDLGEFYEESGRVRAEESYVRAREMFEAAEAFAYEVTECSNRIANLGRSDLQVDVDELVDAIFADSVRPPDDDDADGNTLLVTAANVEQLMELFADEVISSWQDTQPGDEPDTPILVETALSRLRELIQSAVDTHFALYDEGDGTDDD